MCPRTPPTLHSRGSTLPPANDAYYCSQETAYVNEITGIALCALCILATGARYEDGWRCLFRHILTIGEEPLVSRCARCNIGYTVIVRGPECITCTTKFEDIASAERYQHIELPQLPFSISIANITEELENDRESLPPECYDLSDEEEER